MTDSPTDTTSIKNSVTLNRNTSFEWVSDIYQLHEGGGATRAVSYVYDETVDGSNIYTNGLRQKSVEYPDDRKIHSTFGTSGSLADLLHRVDMLEEDSSGSPGTDLVKYSYNGTGHTVVTDYQVPSVKLDHYQGTSGTYAGLDRFGRVKDHYWSKYSGGTTALSRIKHGYDAAGNRTWREDVVAGAKNHDEFYTYDNLHRLVNFDRGNLTSPPTGISTPGREQDFSLDQLGNWSGLVAKSAGVTDLNQSRSHNSVNEIDTDEIHGDADPSITGTPNWADPIHDAAGNMTQMPQPASPTASFTLKYDAWNRLVEVKDGSDIVQQNEYDGLGQRIVQSVYDSGSLDYHIHYYYNDQWQLLEERKEESGTEDPEPLAQYVWNPDYIDSLALRYYDASTGGTQVRHWYLQGANFNVTAVVDDSAAVLERYQYSPYGEVTFLEDDFDVKSASTISNTHLYTGRERDVKTGLQLNRNRYYAPHLGRWVNRDPIGYWGGINLYGYVGGMPTYYVDPSGLGWREWALGEDKDDTPWVDRGKGKQAPPAPDLSEGPLTPIRSGQAIDAEGIASIQEGAQNVANLIPGGELGQSMLGKRVFTDEDITGGEHAAAWGMALSGPVVGAIGKFLKCAKPVSNLKAPKGPMTPDQQALKELVNEATHSGRKPLTVDQADTVLDWADEVGYPGVRAHPGDVADPSNWQANPVPHINIPGAGRHGHVPVQPGVQPR